MNTLYMVVSKTFSRSFLPTKAFRQSSKNIHWETTYSPTKGLSFSFPLRRYKGHNGKRNQFSLFSFHTTSIYFACYPKGKFSQHGVTVRDKITTFLNTCSSRLFLVHSSVRSNFRQSALRSLKTSSSQILEKMPFLKYALLSKCFHEI